MTLKYFLIPTFLTLALSITSAFAEDSYMSPQMQVRNVPITHFEAPRNILLLADKPGDLLLTNQKKSLRRVDLSKQLLETSQIQDLYRNRLKNNLDNDQIEKILKGSYQVYENFIDGFENKQGFAAINSQDNAQFWQVVFLDAHKVNHSILQMEWFGTVTGGHAQIRFQLNMPLLLISQKNPREFKFIDGDIIYSLQAVRTTTGGQKWGAVTALTGAFANSYIFASSSHMAHLQTSLDNASYIEQFQLNLNSDQQNNLFRNALRVGTQVQEKEIYHLFFNNCVEAALRAIQTVDNRVDAWQFNPYLVVSELQQINLISEQLQSVNEEFQSPVQTRRPLDRDLISIMETKIFNESLRSFAAVLVDDRWTTSELETAIRLIQLNKVDLQKTDILTAANLIAEELKKRNAQNSKTSLTVQKMLQSLVKILAENKIELPELIRLLN